MPSGLKMEMARELARRFPPGAGYLFVSFKGLDAVRAADLRRLLRQERVEIEVVKNRIFAKALLEAGAADLAESRELRKILRGPTAIVRGEDGAIAAARAVAAWRKKDQAVEIKGGILEGRVLCEREAEGLARIPDRPALLARVVGGFAAPVARLQGVLNGVVRKLVYALRAIEEKKGGAAGSAAAGR